jgi:hypothetical protein
MTGVDHGSADDAQATPLEWAQGRDEAPPVRESPDVRDQLASLIGDEPCVEPGPGKPAASAIDHDAHPCVQHEQSGGRVSRRGLCADAEGDEPHGKRG